MYAAPAHPSPPTLHSKEEAEAYRRHVQAAARVGSVTPDQHRSPSPGDRVPVPEPVPVGH